MKIYLMFLMVLFPIASLAASKCLIEIGSFCPSNVEQIECLRTNLAKFSPKCTEAIKVMIASAQPEKKLLCEEDTKKLCASEKDDPKKLGTCLNTNFQMLSAECQKSGEFIVARAKETLPTAPVPAANPVAVVKPASPVAPAPSDPCENDLKTLCPNMKVSEQLNCLQSQLERVNPECSSMIGNMLSMKSNLDKAKAACQLDAEKLCPSETGDKEKKAACMKANEANLSAECKNNGGWVE
ncbi:MAG: hypothetical protein ACXWC9_00355 [Pseudobdellovibrionaceae bacterium]